MGFIIIIPIAALAVYGIAGVFRRLQRGNFGREWWKAFKILTLAGLGLGVWFGFVLEYKIANKRIAGFPIPVAIADREVTGPLEGILPAPVRYAGIVTDFLSGIALGLAPIAAAAFIHENRIKHDPPDNPRG
jgi:hypothetical protein